MSRQIFLSDARNTELCGEILHLLSDLLDFFVFLENSDKVLQLLARLGLDAERDLDCFFAKNCNFIHIFLNKTSGGESGRPESDSAWGHG